MKIRSSDGAMKKMTKRKKRTTFEICWKAANKQSSSRRRESNDAAKESWKKTKWDSNLLDDHPFILNKPIMGKT